MSALQAKYPEKPLRGSSPKAHQERPRRSPLVRVAVFLAKAFAVLLLLLVLAAGGGLYWLSTPSAEQRILDEMSRLLANQGITFTAAKLSGFLPQRLVIEDILLADSHGPLLKAARAELRWSMPALLRGTVLVEAVELQDPELFRLPDPVPDTQKETPPETSGSFSLPVDIRLSSLSIQGGRLHMAVLRPEAGPDEPSLSFALTGSASLDSRGLTGALRCALRQPDKGGFSLDLRLESGLGGTHAGTEDSLSLDIAGSEPSGGLLSMLLDRPDLPAYALQLKGDGGLKDWRGTLSLLAGQTDSSLPRTGGRDGEADVTSAIRPDVLALSMDLGLRCATGSLWRDLAMKPAFSARVAAEAKPGERTPPSLLPVLDGNAKANLEFAAAEGVFTLKADAAASAWRLSVADATLRPVTADSLAVEPKIGRASTWDSGTALQEDVLSFKALVQAAVTDPAAFAAASPQAAGQKEEASDTSAAQGFPLRAASFTANLSGGLGKSASGLKLDGSLEAQTQDRTFAIPCALEAEARGQRVTLRRLDLRGLGITAQVAADLDTGSGAVRATADILAEDKAEWQMLATRLAGFDQHSGADHQMADGTAPGASPPLGGEIRLNASLDLPGRTPVSADGNNGTAPDASGNIPSGSGLLQLTGSNMRWPTAQLAGMLGSSLNLSAKLSAGKSAWDSGGPESWTVILEEARAGILSASGKAVFTPPPQNSGTPVTPSEAASRTDVPDFTAGTLEAELRAGISDLKPLDPGLSGALTATAKATGRLNALDIQLNADSPSLTLPSGVFQGLSLRIAAHNAMTPATATAENRKAKSSGHADGSGKAHGNPLSGGKANSGRATGGQDVDLNGTLALKAANSPGGPLSLSGRWQAGLPADGRNISAALNDFVAQGAGVKLTASLAAAMAGQAKEPENAATATPAASAQNSGHAATSPDTALPLSLKGEVNADVEDWNKIAALAGTPLSGGPARLRLRLDNAGGAQSATMDLNLHSLILKNPDSGQTDFSLEDVSAALVLPRLTTDVASLAPDFRLRLGKGLAGPLQWSGGGGTVKGRAGAGEFALFLSRGTKTAGQNAADILDVRGRYDLKRQEAVVNALALQLPLKSSSDGNGPQKTATAKNTAGLRLQKPLTLKFVDGLQASGLDMAFQPGGRLTADASLTSGTLRAKAELQSLPFSFFALFTDAPLPGGELRLLADLSSTAQGPRGTVTVQSRISPARTQTGLVKSSAQTGKTGGMAAAPSADAFDLQVTATLAASPGPSAVPGSTVRSLPGFVWLNGTGTFGRASASDSAKEGRMAFQIPLRLAPSGLPLPDNGAPMAAAVHWNGSVAPLWQAVPLPDRYLSGQALLDLAVTGSLDKPRPALSAYLGQGRYEDISNGVLLTDIKLEAKATPDGNLNALLAAGDGDKGTLALEASVRGFLDKKAPILAVRGQLNGLSPLHRDDLLISLSGIFGVNGPADAPAVTANIRVDQGELTLSSKLGGSVPILEISSGSLNGDAATPKMAGEKTGLSAGKTAAAPKAAGRSDTVKAKAEAKPGKTSATAVAARKTAATPPPAASAGSSLDVRISVPRQFFIRGMGMDSEWEGDLLINGPIPDPSLTGALRPVRGYLEVLSKTFEFTGGDISFTGGMRINPLLNLELTHKGPSITAIIRAAGTAKKPEMHLESIPPLPRDEILAEVLFGKRTSDLSRFEAIQLANSLRELSNTGGSSLDVLTGIRKTVGLDVLRVGSEDQASQRTTSGQSGENELVDQRDSGGEAAGAPTLEAGKYINDSIYIGVEQGASPESTAVRVEIELYPSVNLQGQSSATSTEVGIGWKKDY